MAKSLAECLNMRMRKDGKMVPVHQLKQDELDLIKKRAGVDNFDSEAGKEYTLAALTGILSERQGTKESILAQIEEQDPRGYANQMRKDQTPWGKEQRKKAGEIAKSRKDLQAELEAQRGTVEERTLAADIARTTVANNPDTIPFDYTPEKTAELEQNIANGLIRDMAGWKATESRKVAEAHRIAYTKLKEAIEDEERANDSPAELTAKRVGEYNRRLQELSEIEALREVAEELEVSEEEITAALLEDTKAEDIKAEDVQEEAARENMRLDMVKKEAKSKQARDRYNKVNPDKDNLLTAIAKLGGLNFDSAFKEWRETITDITRDQSKNTPLYGKPVIRKKGGGGLPIDKMAEALSELGYLSKDQHGKWDLNELFNKLQSAIAEDTQDNTSEEWFIAGQEDFYREAANEEVDPAAISEAKRSIQASVAEETGRTEVEVRQAAEGLEALYDERNETAAAAAELKDPPPPSQPVAEEATKGAPQSPPGETAANPLPRLKSNGKKLGKAVLNATRDKGGLSISLVDEKGRPTDMSGELIDTGDPISKQTLAEISEDLTALSRQLYADGANTFSKFRKALKQATGDMWPRVKPILRKLWNATKAKTSDYILSRQPKVLDEPTGKAAAPVDPFYSPLQRAVEGANMPRKAQAIPNYLQKQGVSPEEIKWLDIDGWLQDNAKDGKIDKAALADYVRANQVEIKEVTKGETGGLADLKTRQREAQERGDDVLAGRLQSEVDFEEQNDLEAGSADLGTKFSQYQLPGGTNYKELLFTLPTKVRVKGYDIRTKAGIRKGIFQSKEEADSFVAKSGRKDLEISPQEEKDKQYQSSHFPEPNVLAHVHMNDRTGPNGEKILFLEEVQSDWLQDAKEKGFKEDRVKLPNKPGSYDDLIVGDSLRGWGKISNIRAKRDGTREFDVGGLWIGQDKFNLDVVLGRDEVWTDSVAQNEQGVPRAPFLNEWHELVLKRMIRYGASNGYDHIAWTTGDQQADRYDLSKQVESVYAFKQRNGGYHVNAITPSGDNVLGKIVSADGLADTLGKELAEKILAGNNTDKDFAGVPGENHISRQVFEGEDLRVGGAGMRSFYDEKIPGFLNKYAKRWGAKTSMVDIGAPNVYASKTINGDFTIQDKEGDYFTGNPQELWSGDTDKALVFDTKQEAEAAIKKEIGGFVPLATPVHSLPITPAMKQSVIYDGQPMWGRNGVIAKAQNALKNQKGSVPVGQLYTDLETIGKFFYANGADTFSKFRARMKSTFAESWAKIRPILRKLWEAAKRGTTDYILSKQPHVLDEPKGKAADKAPKKPASVEREPISLADWKTQKDKAVAKARAKGILEGKKVGRKEKHVEMRRKIVDKELSTAEAVRDIKAEIMTLPMEERGRKTLLDSLTSVNTTQKIETQWTKLFAAMDKVAEVREMAERKKLRGKIAKLLDRQTPRKDKTGITRNTKTDAAAQDKIDEIKPLLGKDYYEAQDKILANEELAANGNEQAIEENFWFGFHGIKDMPSGQLSTVLEEIEAIVADGRTRMEVARENRKAREEFDREVTIEVTTGGKDLPSSNQASKKKGVLDKIGNWQMRLDNILDKLSKYDPSAPYQSRISQRFGEMVRAARGAQEVGTNTNLKEIYSALPEIFNVKPGQIYNVLTSLSRKTKLGTFKDKHGLDFELELTRDQMIKKYQEFMDPTLHDTFFGDKMAWTPEIMNAIVTDLTAEEKRWGDYMLDFYQKYYESVNAVYREHYGVNLPHNPNYSPISRDVAKTISEPSLVMKEQFSYGNATNGSHKNRVDNEHSLKHMGATDVLVNHITQMEHFKAFAGPLRELRATFGNPEVQQAIKQFHGDNMLEQLQTVFEDIDADGRDRANTLRWMDRLRVRFTRAVLGLNPLVAIKQIPSGLAFATEMPYTDFVTGVSGFWRNPIENHRFLMKHSGKYEARHSRGHERDIRDALGNSPAKKLSMRGSWLDYTMEHIRLGDKFATSQGMWAAYKHGLKKFDGDQKEAMLFAEGIMDRTQPGSAVETLGRLRRTGSVGKALSMFMDQPNRYFTLIGDNLRNFYYGRGSRTKAASNVVLAWVVLPMLFRAISEAWGVGDDEPDPVEVMLSTMFGPLNYILGIGSILKAIQEATIKGSTFSYQASPAISSIDEFRQAGLKVHKMVENDEIKTSDMVRLIEHLARGTGGATGLPVHYGVRVARAIADDDWREFIWGRYAIKGKRKKKSASSGTLSTSLETTFDSLDTKL